MLSELLELPTKMKQLLDVMEPAGQDVTVVKMFEAVKGEKATAEYRHLQQHMGPYITRLNRRLAQYRYRVEPGRLKGTYRLSRKSK